MQMLEKKKTWLQRMLVLFCLALSLAGLCLHNASAKKKANELELMCHQGDDGLEVTELIGAKGDVVIPEKYYDMAVVALDELIIPEGVTTLAIPASVKRINGMMDYHCSVTAFIVAEDNPVYTARDGVIFSKDMKTLVACPASLESYTIPEGVTAVQAGAFFHWDCVVTVPASVKTIAVNNPQDTGMVRVHTRAVFQVSSDNPGIANLPVTGADPAQFDYMVYSEHFNNTYSIIVQALGVRFEDFSAIFPAQRVTVDNDNPVYQEQDGMVLSKDGGTLFFVGVDGIDKHGVIAVPEGVHTIAKGALQYTTQIMGESLTVRVPESVAAIEAEAFNSYLIACIELPGNITSIDSRAFNAYRPDLTVSAPVDSATAKLLQHLIDTGVQFSLKLK